MARAAGKGASGTGTIRKITVNKDGHRYTYWHGRYTAGYDPGSGRQIQRTVTGKTQKEVSLRLRQLTSELDQGTYIAPNKETVKPDITLNVYTHADYDYVEHAFRKALNG